MTKTYYYIEAMHIPAREPFKYDAVHFCVLDKKISLDEYIKIIDETENEVIIEENVDYPRLFKYYTTKAYAQQILKQIIERRSAKFNTHLDLPKVPNMMVDMIKDTFKEKK